MFDLTVRTGHDKIMDFQHTNDSLTFEIASGNTLADLNQHVTFVGNDGTGHVAVRFDNGGVIDFKNVLYTNQNEIADLVANPATQIHVIHP